MKSKPLIGISCMYDYSNAIGGGTGMGIEGQDWNFVAGDYIYAIEQAGGVPLLLPRCRDFHTLEPLVDSLDGLLLSGGYDIDPLRYGERAEAKCGQIIPQRDEADIALFLRAFRNGKRILGICRGCQLINVALKGSLYQDLEMEGKYKNHMAAISPRQFPVHKVCFEKGTTLAEIYGKETFVNSYHHQAVKQPGEGIRIIARSEDGIVEAIEADNHSGFVVGVQWHPEMMYDSEAHQRLFRMFVGE